MKETRFKQTEIGEVPEDWEVKPVRHCCDVKRGVRVTREMLSAGGKYPVFQNTNYPLGYFNKYNVQANTPFVIIGGSAGLIGTCTSNYWAADDCAYFSKSNKIDHTFLYYELQHRQFDINKHVRNASVPRLDRKVIEDLVLPVPTVEEQERIAEALSDVDGLLRELDGVIAKKRAIKQGAMQELLTGKRRLEGFTGEWEEKKLGELGHWSKGQPFAKDDIRLDGCNACIHYGELFTRYTEIIKNVASKTDKIVEKISKYGDILFPASDVTPTGLGRCSAIMIDGVLLGGDIIILSPIIDLCSSFLSYSINLNKKQIIERVTGTTVKHITSRALSEITVLIPPTKAEQEAIVNILSDMDEEIAALEAKRAKYEQVKQGMMQELLTGRVRLINTIQRTINC